MERAGGDLDDPASLDPALRGVDRVFLVTMDINQDEHVVVAARRAGASHIVKLSALGAGQPSIQLDRWHHAREEIIRASGLAWTFLRPGQFASNALQWVGTVKAQGAVFFPGGAGTVAPIDPRDIAAVAAVALTQPGHEGQAYELTGPLLMTVGEQVDALAHALGRPVRYVDIPSSAVAEQMRGFGLPDDTVEALVELWAAVQDGHAAQVTDTVERITGRAARAFEEWCRAHVTSFE